jgi:hypothetical protein
MIVERVADTLIMATIIVIIISGNGFIGITLRLCFVESAISQGGRGQRHEHDNVRIPVGVSAISSGILKKEEKRTKVLSLPLDSITSTQDKLTKGSCNAWNALSSRCRAHLSTLDMTQLVKRLATATTLFHRAITISVSCLGFRV